MLFVTQDHTACKDSRATHKFKLLSPAATNSAALLGHFLPQSLTAKADWSTTANQQIESAGSPAQPCVSNLPQQLPRRNDHRMLRQIRQSSERWVTNYQRIWHVTRYYDCRTIPAQVASWRLNNKYSAAKKADFSALTDKTKQIILDFLLPPLKKNYCNKPKTPRVSPRYLVLQ